MAGDFNPFTVGVNHDIPHQFSKMRFKMLSRNRDVFGVIHHNNIG